MKLRITNIHAQLGINKHDAILSIRQPKAELQITTIPTELNTKTERLKITIDQKQCFSEAGLKDIFELTREAAERGKQAVLEAIARTTTEGNRLAMIENKSDAIVEIAAEKSLPAPADTNITFIPRSRPKIDVTGGTVSFSPKRGGVKIDIRAIQPELNTTSPEIEFYFLQKPVFKFEFVGNNVDVSI